MTIRLLTAALLTTTLAACASSAPSRPEGPPRDDAPRGSGAERGGGAVGRIASPLSLALAGLASGPDGQILLSDIPSAAADMFARFDTDGSGGLSQVEHAHWAESILGDPYGRPGHMALDRSRDGTVSRSELVGFFEVAAQRLDANADGVLQRSELLRDVPQSQQRRSRGQGDRPQGRGQGGRPSRG
ncbi:MAG: hypothetical protein WBG08_04085 [Litorimonas sp.]